MRLLIGDIVSDAATAAPEGIAATLDTEVISFSALDEQANRLAGALRSTGIEHGDIVAWWSGPALHNLTGMLACARLGAVFAPLSPHLGPDEARDALEYIGPRMLACDAEHLEPGSGLGVDIAAVGTGAPGGAYDLDARSAAASGTAPVTPDLIDDDPHILYLTSGSTGTPKGVLVSHRASWLRSCPGGGTFATGLHGTGGVLCSFPLYHYGGWHYVLEAWLNRTAVHLVRKADAPHLIGAATRHRPAAIYCIPAVWERVLAEPGDLSFVRHADTGTSAVSADLLASLGARMPEATTSVLYGATEAGRMTVLRHWERGQHGSVGRAVAPGLVTIADDGEILFRGPTLMTGYLRLSEQTQQSVRGGWYHTGDLGYRDGEGYVYITGRKRDVIRSGGETISPAEVEGALRGLPGVDDIAVIGVPDERWGELVCAVVVPNSGHEAPSVATLRARLRGLAQYKHPRAVATVPRIPRTGATGQVMRAQLCETVLADQPKLAWPPSSGMVAPVR